MTRAGFWCIVLAAAHIGRAAPAPTPDMVTDELVLAPVTTQHTVRIGGANVRYSATFTETVLNDEQGKPQATISCTAYVRQNVGDRARRPVFFLFNGGPGASSSPLHFSALGPRRITDERDASGVRKLTDNAESILDVADLVFVDPVGTGFSRERAGARSGAYWSVDSDARSVLELIRTWLTQNQRTTSPLFIVGESYGGVRLATITKYSGDLKIAGLIVISPVLDLSSAFSAPGNDQPFIFDLPSMAIAAWEHGKVERGHRTVDQVYEESARFAQSEYAVALQQGARLPTAERDRLAARMSAMIGLPASLIAASNLRVDSQVFLESLLQAEHRLVGRLDTRITAPKAPPANPDRPAAANDPALALGASNIIRNPAIKTYMERELGVHTARDYISLTLDVNARWDWRGEPPTGAWSEPEFYRNPARNIAALMAKQRQTRLLLLGGYYDLAVPVLGPRYALEHAGVPLDRVSMVALPAGHSPFEGDETRKMGASAVREFLSAALETKGRTASTRALDISLKPHSSNGAVDALDVRLQIEKPQLPADVSLLRMGLVVASIPTTRYDGEAIQAQDDVGPLLLTTKDEAPTPSGTWRQWLTSRPTVGDVTVTYRAVPRAVSASTRPGPLFDLRAEAGGLNGAGLAFLALPDTSDRFHIHLHWDLSGAPAGSRGIWSLGEGDVSTTDTADVLANSYYAVGPVKSYPNDGAGRFAMYWLSPPPFDTQAIAKSIQTLYPFMAHFFHEETSTYRVFVRKNPYRSGGGTALTRSFMFGYNDMKVPTVESLQDLLAHEMTHNWPRMEDESGDTAWYTEGAAEYYSILLSYRSHTIDADEFLKRVNERASTYYTNPLQTLSNDAAAARFWKDTRAQRVPYGRGFMYLTQVDAQVRAQSHGRRSLDDLVLTMLERARRGESHGVGDWLALLTHELGPDAKRDYDAMVNGTRLVPPPGAFGPCFEPEPTKDRMFDLGFDIASLDAHPKIVQGLVAGSAAAAAGIREGDEIIETSELADVQNESDKPLTVKVRRGAEELSLEYVPRGRTTESYRWVRRPGVSEKRCRL